MKAHEFTIDTPIGGLVVVHVDSTVLAAEFADRRDRLDRWQMKTGTIAEGSGEGESVIRAALNAYFSGQANALDVIPVAIGGDGMSRAVWEALVRIPVGDTLTYGGLAKQLGKPKAARAVGRATGANPIALFVPCHRVVGASGALTGYAGGLERKQWLLAHEGAL